MSLASIQSAIEPLRQRIIQHPVYAAIQSIEDLHQFMRLHVYAVWDFMSLLKSLQQSLTCTTTPWFPVGSANTRFLINEIVVGEESDVDAMGNRKSHFELYLDAMEQAGADTGEINAFIQHLQATGDLEAAFAHAGTPEAARAFVRFTFETINSGRPDVQAAVFTFGREDLIPGMFISMIREMAQSHPAQISTFKYYLERHIEVDGDHHSHLALEMTAELCGTDADHWAQATVYSQRGLEQRIKLWDGVCSLINERAVMPVE